GDFRRDAVPVHGPPRLRVPKEAFLLRLAQRLPDRLAVRPQRVDSRPPPDRGPAPAQPAPEAEDIAERDLAPLDLRRLEGRMAPGQLPAAGQGKDLSAMDIGVQRQDEGERGQARAA